MKKLVALALGPDGQVKDDVAAMLVGRLDRSALKAFLAALRRELKRRSVRVSVAGDSGPGFGGRVSGLYPGKDIEVTRDELLGAGVRVSAGDDIVDASVCGYIREIIEELGGI